MKYSNTRSSSNNRPFKRNNNYRRPGDQPNSSPKVSGNLTTVLEKYRNLAKDATSAGDWVAAENYLQHAEHYIRVLNERNSRNTAENTKPVNENNISKTEDNSKKEPSVSDVNSQPIDIAKALKSIPIEEDKNEDEKPKVKMVTIKKKIVKKATAIKE